MECLNKVQLKGWVGNSQVSTFGATKVNRFSLATNYAFRDRNGDPIIETTWHRCLVWDRPDLPDIEKIVKGAKVELEGRIRAGKYTGADGVEASYWEILVQNFKVLDD